MNTIVINAFGGPCAGKTTACWEIASELKKRGITCEYVSEYTKDLIYDGKMYMLDDTMFHQQMILCEQRHRLDRLLGKVNVIVTDSPLFLSIVYASDRTDEYITHVLNVFNDYNNFNFIIERGSDEFQQAGRKQNFEESLQKDREIKELLDKYNIKFSSYERNTVSKIIKDISDRI